MKGVTTIAITGSSGNMGVEAVKQIMDRSNCHLRLLLRDSKRGIKTARQYKRRYGERITIVHGEVSDLRSCCRLCQGADYVLHLAAIIPPKADHDANLTMKTNYHGTLNIIEAIIRTGNKAKLVYISTVALYGNRDEKHPWGRVGDPLVTSAFDIYGLSKTMAGYAVLESELNNWVILRQTAVLYDNILMNNVSDGLMFHTPWNALIEWVTAKDSGVLLNNIVEADSNGTCEGFWKKVYNIGGGAATRQTGYETFDDGFKLIGGSVKEFFQPNWNLTRNFHCFWFLDSDVLDDMFHYRSDSISDFWQFYKSKHRIYSAGRLAPISLIRRTVIEPLLKNNNAPMYWLEHEDEARIQAYFGGIEEYSKIPTSWTDTKLICESDEYESMRNPDNYDLLDHGYDESKRDSELTIKDMQQAAEFRGGQCISKTLTKDNMYQKLEWSCHNNHTFIASPYTILKAGHWCPKCCQVPNEWSIDDLAHHSEFHRQIWQDTHDMSENFVYRLLDDEATMEAQ